MSSIAQSSVDECIASCGRPISTVKAETWAVEMFPNVEPPLMSDLFSKSWVGMLFSAAKYLTIEEDNAFDVYVSLALYLIKIPLLR